MAEEKKASTKSTAKKKVEETAKAATKKTAAVPKTTTKMTTANKTTADKKTTTTKKTTAAKKTTVAKKATEEKIEVAEVTAADAPVEAAPIKKETETTVPAPVQVDEFLENFNWHNYQEGIDVIEDDQLKEFEILVAENFVDTADDDVLEGTIVHLTDREAIIDINAKSEGVISLNEFRYNPGLKVGDKVEVIVDIREDKTGQLILSHRKARVIKAWDRVNNAHDNGEIVNGFVKCRTKGGMIVDVFGIEAFLPGSQIDVKPIRDYDQYVDKTMEFKVVKINHEFKNVVVSHKALIEADLEEQKKEIIGQLEKGQVLEGTVKNITSRTTALCELRVIRNQSGVEAFIVVIEELGTKIVTVTIIQIATRCEVVDVPIPARASCGKSEGGLTLDYWNADNTCEVAIVLRTTLCSERPLRLIQVWLCSQELYRT